MDDRVNPFKAPEHLGERPDDLGEPVPGLPRSIEPGEGVFHAPGVIYAARNLPEAFHLRQLLADEGIRAEVINAGFEGGSGGMLGWPTSPRVVVDEADVPRAREIAVEFDRRNIAAAFQPSEEGDLRASGYNVLTAWPRCPQCERQRITRCTICGTAGSHFPYAEQHNPEPEVDVFNPASAATGMACGPNGCGCAPKDAPPDEAAMEAESTEGMVVCTTCDEPFRPVYAQRCEWCGYEFADGYPVDRELTHAEPINGRVIVVVSALILLAVAAVVYFSTIVR